jgi:class III lanthionine synthetase
MLEALVNFEFYETLDEYKPEQGDFYSLVCDLLPESWSFHRNNGVWFGCHPPGDQPLPRQGWKIHLSASLRHARDILAATVPIFRDMQIAFKFCVDRQMLGMMNSKQWVRGGSGKFVTIYPPDEPTFLVLLEKLHNATTGFSGPYILSDRRYKDSKVVYYRYGGIRNISILNITGERTPVLISPEGTPVPDVRYPYFVVPPWTKDPCGSEGLAPGAERPSEVLLKDGRYRVKSVLRYSNSGGIYVAEDRESGMDVVIKEARPGVESTVESVNLLAKEFRLLSAVKEFGIAPQPIDYFQDWEHVFLVQEFLKGWSVSAFAARNNVTLLTSPTFDDVRTYYEKFRKIFIQLAQHIQQLHELGIVFSDLSPENLIISRETQQVWILDFEGAYQIGVDQPIILFTAGFAFADQINGQPADFASDYFAIGAIMHYMLAPVNEIFMINPRARHTFIQNIIKDIGFPPAIGTVISQLLDKDPAKRPTPAAIIKVLELEDGLSAPGFAVDGPEAMPRYQQDVGEIVRHILAVATYERKDRLFPSAGAVFRTNPLNVAHGACGVAYFLNKATGSLPAPVAGWILDFLNQEYYLPPGLYMGLAGIAWSLAECGLLDAAKKVFSRSIGHKLLYDAVDIYYGIAGWGLGALKLFSVTQDERYLDSAKEAARHLLSVKREDELGYCWGEKDVPLGFGHGASGISVFLLYLYLASGDELFLSAGQKALNYDLGQANSTIDGEGGLSWRKSLETKQIVFPYWIYGSAGVGTALVRYYRLTGDPGYLEILEKIFTDTNRKYAVFPNHDKGLAGLGEFNLDLYQVTRDPKHFNGAMRVATGLSLFRVESSKGLTFPGVPLTRASCDFSTGSAGVGHFLHRLSHPELESPFMLDCLFDTKTREEGVLTGVDHERG